LAIVQQTIHAHGGTTSADSTPGVGTTITLTLPVEEGSAMQLAPAEEKG
jgi:signal transduction histidine kinase